jgi:hypothetical protein
MKEDADEDSNDDEQQGEFHCGQCSNPRVPATAASGPSNPRFPRHATNHRFAVVRRNNLAFLGFLAQEIVVRSLPGFVPL